ncbi:MAG: M60 family metallopeptidase [Abditibacteriales bacterium]|nr:M60 family metallopeptidase [Abditibacteriales bacterium]
MVAVLLVCVLLSAAHATPDVAKDVEFLRSGVYKIGWPGVPGPLCVFGEEAFPVIVAEEGGQIVPIVAAARWGKGRLVAFPHDGYLGAVLETADTRRLMTNAILWAGAKETAQPSDVRVGVRHNANLVRRLQAWGFNAQLLNQPNWTAELPKCDVVISTLMDPAMPQTERAALEQFVRSKGGLISANLVWGFLQLHPGKDVNDLPGNQLFASAGITWADGYCSPPPGDLLAVDKLPPLYCHAARALDAVEEWSRTTRTFTNEELNVMTSALSKVFGSVPPPHQTRFTRLFQTLDANANSIPIPSRRRPVTEAAGVGRLLLTLHVWRQQRLPPPQVTADPAAAIFPGAVPTGAQRVTRRVQINTSVPAWHSTGLYAAPGELVTVRVAPQAADKGLSLQIGCHTDTLWHLNRWQRVPELVRRFKVNSSTMQIASAYGGLIYVDVPNNCKLGNVVVEISNAVDAPLFVLGKTDVNAWRTTIRNHPAPWAELATDKVIFTLPSGQVRHLDNPDALLRYWDSVLDAMADICAVPRQRVRPERVVFDEQIAAGYLHSGYPIMGPLNVGAEAVDLPTLQREGHWGIFHELGHNHQQGDWTFEGTGEVTNNVLVLYVLDTLLPHAKGHPAFTPEVRAQKTKTYKDGGTTFEDWKRDPFLALIMYRQLADAFGWDAFKKVFAEYRQLPPSARPKSDDEKRDQWMIRFSRAVGKNLAPFFEYWGIPTSAEARQAIGDLPPFTPPG